MVYFRKKICHDLTKVSRGVGDKIVQSSFTGLRGEIGIGRRDCLERIERNPPNDRRTDVNLICSNNY